MRGTFSGERFSHYDFCDLLGVNKPISLGAGTAVGESYNLLGNAWWWLWWCRGGGVVKSSFINL